MGKIIDRYNEYMPYMNYNGNSEDELYELLTTQKRILEEKNIDIKLSQSTKALNIYTNNIYSGIITPYHKHDYFEINYVISGRVMEYVDGRKIILTDGDMLLMSPETYHTSHPIGTTEAKNIIIDSDYARNAESAIRKYNADNYLSYIINNSAYVVFRNIRHLGIENIIGEITEINHNKWQYEPYTAAFLNHLATGLFLKLSQAEIAEHPYKKNSDTTKTQIKDENFKKYLAARDDRIMWYINDHYNNISLEKLSKQFGYSEQQIRRIVKKRTGNTYSTYIQVVRLTKATDMLINTEKTIKEIAEAAGIESPEYFSRWFKHEHHTTPTEYRKRYRNK